MCLFLSGGFSEFSHLFPGLCEGKSTLVPSCISQPCLPVTNIGPTRILPHLYLGCQRDVLNKVSEWRFFSFSCINPLLLGPLQRLWRAAVVSKLTENTHERCTGALVWLFWQIFGFNMNTLPLDTDQVLIIVSTHFAFISK